MAAIPLLLAASAGARADTLGTLTYAVPSGWDLIEQDATRAVYRRALADGSASARITVYADRPAGGTEFEAAWREAGAATGRVTKVGATRSAGGLTMREAFISPAAGGQGYLTLAVHRAGTCAARIVLLVEPGAKAAAFGTDLGAVLASLRHDPSCGESPAVRAIIDPEPGARPPGFDLPVEGDGPGRPVSLVGGWQRVGSSARSFRPGAGSGTEARYDFAGDGTYAFNGVARGSANPDAWLRRIESGNYLVIGRNVRVSARECRIEVREGARDAPLQRTEPCRPDPQMYRATWVWLDGPEQWRLVLEPDRETERDGPFGGLAEHPEAYAFRPVATP